MTSLTAEQKIIRDILIAGRGGIVRRFCERPAPARRHRTAAG